MESKTKIQTFKDLEAWKYAQALAVSVYCTTRKFPKEELFGIVSQMRRSGVSIASNIAEGFSRSTPRDKSQFYSIAKGSSTELQTQLLIARDVGYISDKDFTQLDEQARRVDSLISGLLKYTRSLLLLFFTFVLYTFPLILPLSASAANIISVPGNNLGLVGYWRMDGNDINWGTSKVADMSGAGNQGTLTNITNANTLAGKIGQALSFNGSSSYIDLGTSISSNTGSQTVSAWIRPRTTSGGMYVPIGNLNSGGTAANFLVELNRTSGSGLISASIGNTFPVLTGTTVLQAGRWYHVVYTRQGTSGNYRVNLYVNGVLDNSASTGATPTTGTGTTIGRVGDNSNFYFPGDIDDVRIYNRALSDSEVRALYGTNKIVPSQSLGVTRVFLTANPGAGNQTWTVPSDWNSSKNSIECIGSGGKGATGNPNGGGGGGGGAYAKITNLSLTPGGTVTYAIGASATTTTDSAAVGMARETYFNGAASSSALLSCSYGKFGQSPTGGVGGSAALSTGDTKYAGGNGGTAGLYAGAGGGGSGGPTGAGKKGGDTSYLGGAGGGGSNGGASSAGMDNSSTPGTDGGNGTSGGGGGVGGSPATAGTAGKGAGGGGGSNGANGANGSLDTSFDSTRGAGGGGGGGGYASGAGGAGATYGGGGGGGGYINLAGGTGGQGIIVVSYTPSALIPRVGKSNAAVGGDALAGYWTFDGGKTNWATGTTLDSSGNGNTAQMIGMSTTTSPVPGKVGQGLSFDGVGSYVTASNNTAITSSQTSVSVWVKINSYTQANPRIFEIQDGTNSIQLIRDGASGLWVTKHSQFQTGSDGTQWNTPATGVWQHIVVVWDSVGNSTTFYVNGVAQTGAANTNIGTGNQANKVFFGVRSDQSSTTWFNGSLDDVRIYNRALSADEVRQLYLATK